MGFFADVGPLQVFVSTHVSGKAIIWALLMEMLLWLTADTA